MTSIAYDTPSTTYDAMIDDVLGRTARMQVAVNVARTVELIATVYPDLDLAPLIEHMRREVAYQ